MKVCSLCELWVTEAGFDAMSAWTSSERPNDRAGVIVTLVTGSGRCGTVREGFWLKSTIV